MNNKNIDRRVIVVSGPSGSGKSTAVQKLVETNPGKYELIRSVTTRKRRADDDYYFFVTEEMFEKMLQTDAFLETNTYQGNQCMPIIYVPQIKKRNAAPVTESRKKIWKTWYW